MKKAGDSRIGGAATANVEKKQAAARDAKGCWFFTAEDAAAPLDIPAADVKTKLEKLYGGFWMCSCSSRNPDDSLNGSLTIFKGGSRGATHFELAGIEVPADARDWG